MNFTSEDKWSWAFLCWKILINSFNLITCYKSSQVFPFLLSFGNFCLSRNLSISSKLSNLLAQTCSQYSLRSLLISVVSVVMFPFSFLILLMCLSFFVLFCQSTLRFGNIVIFSNDVLLFSSIFSIFVFYARVQKSLKFISTVGFYFNSIVFGTYSFSIILIY